MKLSEFNIEDNLFRTITVNWVDIVTSGGWIDKDKMEAEHKAPDVCLTIGFLSHWGKIRDTEYIVISSSHSTNNPDQYNQHIVIPYGCIIDINTV